MRFAAPITMRSASTRCRGGTDSRSIHAYHTYVHAWLHAKVNARMNAPIVKQQMQAPAEYVHVYKHTPHNKTAPSMSGTFTTTFLMHCSHTYMYLQAAKIHPSMPTYMHA
jgi:hypothetical protein